MQLLAEIELLGEPLNGLRRVKALLNVKKPQ